MNRQTSVTSAKTALFIWLPVAVITLLHYTTGEYFHWMHDILRRLYYLPIITAAFMLGLRRSLLVSLSISFLYFPHAFTSILNKDPAGSIDKALEILLYNCVAFLTGTLVEKRNREKEKSQRAASHLEKKVEEIQSLEQQLIRTEKLKALGEMTAGLAHEIKNPLASIKGSAEIIGDTVPESSPRRKMVTIQKKEINRMEKLLEQFLSFARPRPVTHSEILLNHSLLHARDMIKTQIDTTVSVSVQLHESDDLTVIGNTERLTQLFVNLLLNAGEAVDRNGKIRISTEPREKHGSSYVAVSIHDTGSGIPEDVRNNVFDPFFTDKETGTGLGLSIAARIVEDHNGMIEIRSTPEIKGTEITILLPRSSSCRTDNKE